jgi:uncharacterized membrane protein YdbT with pleckstrin-like domain
LKLGEPLINGIRDFRATSFVVILNDRHVCVESLKVSLLALSGGDRIVEVIAEVFPWTGAVSQRIPQEIRTGEIGWAPSTSKIDLLIAAGFTFADLPIECDCHVASSA